MRVALGLARRGLGNTHPNPTVGCVLARPDWNNRVVGRGWTQAGGRPHAETVALKQAGDQAKGATAYVTLEPCCHHGETAPCSDALIAAGIKRAVIAMEDPDHRVSGQGITALKEAGIHVTTEVCSAEAKHLNAGFVMRILENRPTFTLKTATTLDSKIATASGDSQWITGPEARAAGHALRATHDAILTGIGTVMADDPLLTCRLPGCEARSPIRIVLDAGLSITNNHALIKSASLDAPVWIFVSEKIVSSEDTVRRKLTDGVRVFYSPETNEGYVDPGFVANTLAGEGITRVLIESGGTVAASFIAAGLVDQIVWFRAASLIGGDGKSAIAGLGVDTLETTQIFERISARQVGADMMETYIANPA